MLQWQGWVHPQPLFPGRGAGTGERHGNHMARLGLYSVIQHMHEQIPAVVPAQWVDDLPLRCYGGDAWVEDNLVEAVQCLQVDLQNRGLGLASKS
eukprot:7816425-Lingulodinium_polyedra.AAC.1